MRIKEIIVVEGKSDSIKIKQAFDADTIETNGSAINRQTLELLRHAHEKRGIIVFTDPDYAGERIRHIIQAEIPGCKHAFLHKDDALPKKRGNSVGIEHASIAAIRHALKNVHEHSEVEDDQYDRVKKIDLLQHGLIGVPTANERRRLLGRRLHIGETNGKQLLKRLQMFLITRDEFEQAMASIEEEWQNSAREDNLNGQ